MSDDRDDRPTLMLIARRHAAEPSAKLTAALERTLLDVDPEFDRRAIVSGVSMRQNSMADFLNQFALSGVSGGVTGRRVIGLILFDVVKLVAPGVVVGLVVTVAIVRVNAASPSAPSSRWGTSLAPRLRCSPQLPRALPPPAVPHRSSRWWRCDRRSIVIPWPKSSEL